MRAALVSNDDDGSNDADAVCWARADRTAFEPLYRRYRDRVYRYLLTRTPQDADAADLTQQVFLAALDRLAQYDETRGTFAAWLFGIARHSAVDFQRHHRRRHEREDVLRGVLGVVAKESTEDDVILRDEIRLLHSLVAELPDDKREILALRFAGGLTITEIAAVVDKSAEATRKQLHRTIQFLQERYSDSVRQELR